MIQLIGPVVRVRRRVPLPAADLRYPLRFSKLLFFYSKFFFYPLPLGNVLRRPSQDDRVSCIISDEFSLRMEDPGRAVFADESVIYAVRAA